MSEFYVYAYLREDGSPYYIGKGKGERAYKPHESVQRPPKERIKILLGDLSEEDAFDFEIKLIELYGRQNNNTGCLRNRTDGGEGNTGVVNVKWINNGSEEKRIKMTDRIPIGWNRGRLWSFSNYYMINNGENNRAIKKSDKIPKGWVVGRISSATQGRISITNEKETKFIDSNSKIPEGWRKGTAYRHDAEKLKRVAEGNRNWIWITDGQNNKRVRKDIIIPIGWSQGRTGEKVKEPKELINNILQDYKSGISKSEISRKYSMRRGRVRDIIKNPEDYIE